MRSLTTLALLATAGLLAFSACSREAVEYGTDATEADTLAIQEDTDNLGQEVREAAKETGEAIGEAVEETGEAIGAAGRQIKESSGGTDR